MPSLFAHDIKNEIQYFYLIFHLLVDQSEIWWKGNKEIYYIILISYSWIYNSWKQVMSVHSKGYVHKTYKMFFTLA